MWGGAGNDVYYVDSASDQTNEAFSASNLATDADGSDLVYSSATRTLGNYLENLTLTGTVAINGTGNTLANTIIGNGAANTLNGSSGNDTLIGGLGNDTLSGGTGSDVFVFNSATANNLDTILDFATGTDKIQLSKSIFADLAATVNLTESAFWSAAGAVKGNDATDRVVYNTTTGALYYDADGSGSGASVQIALLGTSTTTAFTDFAVIA
jgi:serralysin